MLIIVLERYSGYGYLKIVIIIINQTIFITYRNGPNKIWRSTTFNVKSIL